MAASLFSTRWYRVADLAPRLRPQTRVRRKRWRDQRWYLLTDDATGRHHRINDAAYQFVGLFDGGRTVQQVWDTVLGRMGDQAPTQDEIVDLLIGLHDAELLQFDRLQDIDALFQRQDEKRARLHGSRLNPFAFRLPLGDPNALLARLDGFGRRLFRPAAFWLWLLAVTLAPLVATSHWRELAAYGTTRLQSPGFLALLWFVYPALKLLHELGHGLAVRRWGGEVHEAGVSLLVLVPAPYVDASAASGFIGRDQRALVGAAGIMVETGIAALGLALWLQLSDGAFRDLAFALLLIGSLSTLLFNGNPLLRFDGYHVLCDLFDLPNLASRSAAYWNHLLRQHLLRLDSAPPQTASGERKWLFAYAPLSLAYRLAISLSIVIWLSSLWLALALLAAAYLAVATILRPLWHWATQSLQMAGPGRQQATVRRRLATLIAAPVLAACIVPVPHATLAPAVVWLPDQAHLRPEVDGFIAELPVADGSAVRPGTLVARLTNPELVAERDKLAGRLAGLQAERYRLLLRDPVGAQNQAQLIARTESELERLESRLAQLEIRANAAGRLVMPRQADLPGSFVKQGAPLGYVLADNDTLIRATVPARDIHLVQTATQAAHVQLAEASGTRFDARVRIDTPAATHSLPSPALGDRGGGPFLTDPTDQAGTRLLEPVFMVDLNSAEALPQHIGERAWVRFEHGYTPLAAQLYRRAEQLFLKQGKPLG